MPLSSSRLPTTLSEFAKRFAKEYPWQFLVFFITPISMVLEANVIPYSLKMLVDVVVEYKGDRQDILPSLAPAIWLGGSAWIILIIISRTQNWWTSHVIPLFEAQLRMSLLRYATSHSYNYFVNHLAGSISIKISEFPKTLDNIRMIISWKCITTASVVITALLIMLTVHPMFAGILTLWIIIQVPILKYFGKAINEISEENAEYKSQLVGQIADTLTNIVTVKLFSGKKNEEEFIGQTQLKEQVTHSQLISKMNIAKLTLDIMSSILLGCMVYLLIYYWKSKVVSSGDFVFIIYATINVMLQVWFLGMELPNLFREIGAANQSLKFLKDPSDINDVSDKELKVTQGTIVFHNVSFGYKQKPHLFINKNVVIRSTKKVGLVGPSGSGKSTFVNLILRFFEVETGQITIDMQDISQVTQRSLWSQISMIPQDTTLFHRTLMENIRYGRLEASDDEVIEAAKKAHAHEFIISLPEKYHTQVGERGAKLSGGERQRIAIARAILKNAPILILDEATSALDLVTESSVYNSLQELMKGRTTIVITHRLPTLVTMDHILVFDKGVIIEEGTHASLMSARGSYARMWDEYNLHLNPNLVLKHDNLSARADNFLL